MRQELHYSERGKASAKRSPSRAMIVSLKWKEKRKPVAYTMGKGYSWNFLKTQYLTGSIIPIVNRAEKPRAKRT